MYELNERQSEAVHHFEGPMMVLAGPGSGKTTIITHRVKFLLEKCKIADKNILVITFTKSAADEMSLRFKNIYGENKVSFGTFHSVFFRIIRRHFNYSIENVLKEGEKKLILKQIIANNFDFDTDNELLDSISNEISLLKNELFDINFYNSNSCGSDDFRKIYFEYEKYKSQKNKIDFDDMLVVCYKLLLSNENVLNFYRQLYKFVLIDEFQDINRAQYECIKLLVRKNLFIVGDDDQSIYKFRGACPEFILNFPKDYPNTKIVKLNKNYRSSEKIISFCNKIISQNKNRYEKNISGVGRIGNNVHIIKFKNITDESIKIAQMIKKNPLQLNDTAIIFRTNIQAQSFITNFMNMNIPYKLKDEVLSLYEHWAVKDILAYLKFSLDNSDNKSLYKIINRPNRYISKTMLVKAAKKSYNILDNLFHDKTLPLFRRTPIEELLFHFDELALKNPYDAVKYVRKIIGYDNYINEFSKLQNINSKWIFEIMDEFCESAKNFSSIKDFIYYAQNFSSNIKNDSNGVTLTTMHSSKGLEFDTVFLISCVEGIIPHEKSKTDSQIEEELRLFYVGLTRAKNNLYISLIENRYELNAKPSRFLTAINEPKGESL
jgi:Superfamily I DNA and RNA helicases